MSKGSIIAIVVIVILIAGGLAYWYSTQGPVNSLLPTMSYQSPVTSSTVVTEPTSTPSAVATVTVTYTDSGFSPSTVTIPKGGTVIFKNAASDAVRVASNPHPLHTGYPTTGGCVGSTFDSCSNIAPGSSWQFTFTFVGSWGYHNHLNPGEHGTVVVQ